MGLTFFSSRCYRHVLLALPQTHTPRSRRAILTSHAHPWFLLSCINPFADVYSIPSMLLLILVSPILSTPRSSPARLDRLATRTNFPWGLCMVTPHLRSLPVRPTRHAVRAIIIRFSMGSLARATFLLSFVLGSLVVYGK